MWVFDGEQWTEEGVSETPRAEIRQPRPDEMYMPELQVIEILPVPRTNPDKYVPLFPIP